MSTKAPTDKHNCLVPFRVQIRDQVTTKWMRMHFRWPQQLAVCTILILSKDRGIQVTQTCMDIAANVGQSQAEHSPRYPSKSEIERKKLICFFHTDTVSRVGPERVVQNVSVWHMHNMYLTSWRYKPVLALLEVNNQEILSTNRQQNWAVSTPEKCWDWYTTVFHQGMWHPAYFLIVKAAGLRFLGRWQFQHSLYLRTFPTITQP